MRRANADGDRSDEEFTPPLITPRRKMCESGLDPREVLSAYCSQKPNYLSARS